MSDLKYLDKKGTFTLDDPDLTSYMYFPLANEAGMMSAITPDLGGDIKLDQNTFLLEPVSSENLHNNKSSRNFWLNFALRAYAHFVRWKHRDVEAPTKKTLFEFTRLAIVSRFLYLYLPEYCLF